MKIHHGHILQLVIAPILIAIQLFLITDLTGLIISLVGITITFLYSNYVTNKQYANSQQSEEKK